MTIDQYESNTFNYTICKNKRVILMSIIFDHSNINTNIEKVLISSLATSDHYSVVYKKIEIDNNVLKLNDMLSVMVTDNRFVVYFFINGQYIKASFKHAKFCFVTLL